VKKDYGWVVGLNESRNDISLAIERLLPTPAKYINFPSSGDQPRKKLPENVECVLASATHWGAPETKDCQAEVVARGCTDEHESEMIKATTVLL
jgi:hypothetical protein